MDKEALHSQTGLTAADVELVYEHYQQTTMTRRRKIGRRLARLCPSPGERTPLHVSSLAVHGKHPRRLRVSVCALR